MFFLLLLLILLLLLVLVFQVRSGILPAFEIFMLRNTIFYENKKTNIKKVEWKWEREMGSEWENKSLNWSWWFGWWCFRQCGHHGTMNNVVNVVCFTTKEDKSHYAFSRWLFLILNLSIIWFFFYFLSLVVLLNRFCSLAYLKFPYLFSTAVTTIFSIFLLFVIKLLLCLYKDHLWKLRNVFVRNTVKLFKLFQHFAVSSFWRYVNSVKDEFLSSCDYQRNAWCFMFHIFSSITHINTN